MSSEKHGSSGSVLDENFHKKLPSATDSILIISYHDNLHQGCAYEHVCPAGDIPGPKSAIPRKTPNYT